MSEFVRQTLEGLRAQNERDGRAYGRALREAEGKPPMPERVVEGSTKLSEDAKAERFRVWWIATMWGFGKVENGRAWSATRFFDRK